MLFLATVRLTTSPSARTRINKIALVVIRFLFLNAAVFLDFRLMPTTSPSTETKINEIALGTYLDLPSLIASRTLSTFR